MGRIAPFVYKFTLLVIFHIAKNGVWIVLTFSIGSLLG